MPTHESPMSVSAALRAAGDAADGRIAVSHGDVRISYAELHARADRVAGTLAARGVGLGDTVAIALYNGVEYLETVLAAFRIGAVPVNINYRYREPELAYVLDHVEAVALVHDESLTERVGGVAGSLPKLTAVLRTGDSAAGTAASYADAAAGGEPVTAVDETGFEHGIILLTGGTTGRPKGVIWDRTGLLGILGSVFRQQGIAAPADPAEVRAAVAGLRERDAVPVVLPMSPLMHGTGFFHAMRTLLGGGTVCFCTSHSLDAHEVWQVVGRERATEMVIVGDAFGRPLVDALGEQRATGTPYDISSMRRITSSGVAWSVDVKRSLLAEGSMTLVDNISASEGGPFGVAEASRDADLADGRFDLAPVARVLDEQDRDVEPGSGRVGVLASAGPQPVGYLRDPERTARTWRVIDGVRYAVPGDLASLDADGKLILLGRGDGVINTGGEKVFPEEVEQALVAHPAVTDAVVIGMPDPRWGQEVTALVAGELSGHSDEALISHLDARLARYKHPRTLIRIDAVPRTPAGKVDRTRAKQLATRNQEENR